MMNPGSGDREHLFRSGGTVGGSGVILGSVLGRNVRSANIPSGVKFGGNSATAKDRGESAAGCDLAGLQDHDADPFWSQCRMYEKHPLEWLTATYYIQPSRIGLICNQPPSMIGRDRWRRKRCSTVRKSAAAFCSGCANRYPSVSPTANPTELTAAKSERSPGVRSTRRVLSLVHLDLKRRQFLFVVP
jgi:hypothetical protein